ncbi:MAG: nickel transporter permease [Candidatus Bathyarchaeia archaeon]|jgi:peptide/nickel transport system permease protein
MSTESRVAQKRSESLAASLLEYRLSFHLLRKNPISFLGLVIIVVFFITAIFAPWLAPYPEQGLGAPNLETRLAPPSLEHLFGTDSLGRDIVSRVIMGSRISLTVSMIVVALAISVGTPLGAVAGYIGGMWDEIIMRITDLFLAFPSLLLAMAIAAALGPSLANSMVALALSWWPWYTRLVRSQGASLRERPFVEAARAMGVPDKNIIARHILPNSLAPVIVQATVDIGTVVLATAALSFIGLGAQPPAPEWGLMVSSGRSYIFEQWWISAFPGLAIFATSLAFNLVGDGLREALDPKVRRSRRA